MNEEKQIEEMAVENLVAFLWHNTNMYDEDLIFDVAETLVKAGYRKRSEGEWHYNPDGMDWGLGAWQCSLCGCRNDNLPMDKNIEPLRWAGSKYCPNCGAKMKGGADNA